MPSRGKHIELSWLFGASALALALWLIPITRPLAIPLIYLNTHVHELGHALAALGTGGEVAHIMVFGDGSGVTPVRGGFMLVIASAGYVGASLVGGWLIASCRREDRARLALRIFGVAMALSMLLFVRGDLVGWVAGGVWTALLLIASYRLSGPSLGFAVAFLGVQQCLTSVHALVTLFNLSVGTETHSDALIMQNRSGLPAVIWASLWIILSALCIGLGVRSALKGNLKTG